MASYSFLAPRPTNAILSDVDHIREIQWILAQWNPSLADDAPEDSKRLVPLDSAKTQYRFERLTGSSWNSVGKLMHDVDTLDGYHASISAVQNTIPVYNADAKLVGDLTGNANTATTLKNIRKLQIGGIASGGSVNFDGSADATIEISQLTVNNANDTAINGILTVKHGGTGGADAATARANLGVPAINHASADKSFGVATTSVYGHAIGSDTINATFTADKGYFFSPKGAYDLRAALDIELAKKLNLSGGTLTGGIEFGGRGGITYRNTDTRKDLIVKAINSNRTDGAVLILKSSDEPGDTSGVAQLSAIAADGTYSTVLLYPDGRWKKDGKDVITSAGGTMTGLLTLSGNLALSNRENESSVITGGPNANNSYIQILGRNFPDGPGRIMMRAKDASGNIGLLDVYPDGRVMIKKGEVLTSAGGFVDHLHLPIGRVVSTQTEGAQEFLLEGGTAGKTAGALLVLRDLRHTGWSNSAGSVALVTRNADGTIGPSLDLYCNGDAWWNGGRVITSVGGTMTGMLRSNIQGGAIASNADNKDVTIFGGSAYKKGAYVKIVGKDATINAGCVELIAENGTSSASMVVHPNGNVTHGLTYSFIYECGHYDDNVGTYAMQLSNGFLIQCGYVESPGSTATVTFMWPYRENYYTLLISDVLVNTTDTAGVSDTSVIRTRSTTGFQTSSVSGRSFSWIAIGRPVE